MRTLLSPVTEIPYENRPARRRPAFSLSAFLSGTFQADMEDALADQIPEASRMKKLYNLYDTSLALPLIRFSLPGAFTPCGLVPVSFSAGPHRYPIGPGFARALGVYLL